MRKSWAWVLMLSVVTTAGAWAQGLDLPELLGTLQETPVDFAFSETLAPLTPSEAREAEAESPAQVFYAGPVVTVTAPEGAGEVRVLDRRRLTAAELGRWRQALAEATAAEDKAEELFFAGRGGSRGYRLPQRALLVALARQATDPQLMVGFEEDGTPRVCASLSGVSGSTAQAVRNKLREREWPPLRQAVQGLQGIVYKQRHSAQGALQQVPMRDVPVVLGDLKTTTDASGYFEFNLSQRPEAPLTLTAGDRVMGQVAFPAEGGPWRYNCFVDIEAGEAQKGFNPMQVLKEGGPAPAQVTGSLAGLLGLPGPLLEALTAGLPFDTGVAYSRGSGVGMYGGVRLDLERRWVDRSLRVVAVPEVLVEVCEYPIGTVGQGAEQAAEVREARRQVAWARETRREAQAQAQSAAGEVEQLSAVLRRLARNAELAEKAAQAAEAEGKADEAIEYYEKANDASEGYLARAKELPEAQRQQAARAETSTAYALLLAASEKGLAYVDTAAVEPRPTQAEVRQAWEKAENALREAEAVLGKALPRKPPAAAIGREGAPPAPARGSTGTQGLPLRFLRISLGGAIPGGQLDLACRERPGRYGVSLGYLAGEEAGQGALALWGLTGGSLQLRPLVGATLPNGDNGSELLFGVTMSLPGSK